MVFILLMLWSLFWAWMQLTWAADNAKNGRNGLAVVNCLGVALCIFTAVFNGAMLWA
jgi:hypothetical protein